MHVPVSSNSAQSPAPPYVTTDLLVATFLRLNGLECDVVALGERTASFRFDNPPSSILSTVADFYDGRTTYNPMDFDRIRAQLRREIGMVLKAAR